MKRKSKKAFTLVELLIVIAIIGVLASMLMPAFTRIFTSANRMTSANAAKQILAAWMNYKTENTPPMLSAKTVHDWAARLAEKVGLNEPTLWMLDFDIAVAEKLSMGANRPQTISNQIGESGTWVLNPEFKAFPISWEVANAIDPTASPKTPVLWTRGLTSQGTWDTNEGVFGVNAGGNIGFADGHVEWFESLKDDKHRGRLLVYGRTQQTYNIADAVRGGERNILKTKLTGASAD